MKEKGAKYEIKSEVQPILQRYLSSTKQINI